MIPLHTRAVCDACRESPAILETRAGIFLCATCAASFTEFEIPSAAHPSSDVDASPANPAPGPAGEAISSNCELEQLKVDGDQMRELAPQQVTAAVVAAPIVRVSNSGDGLGNLKPGSITWGDGIAATAPSGRARDRAICPAVTGSNSNPTPASLASETSVEASVSPPFFSADLGDLESVIADLEAHWLGAFGETFRAERLEKYASTFRVAAASATASTDKSVSVAE